MVVLIFLSADDWAWVSWAQTVVLSNFAIAALSRTAERQSKWAQGCRSLRRVQSAECRVQSAEVR